LRRTQFGCFFSTYICQKRGVEGGPRLRIQRKGKLDLFNKTRTKGAAEPDAKKYLNYGINKQDKTMAMAVAVETKRQNLT